jgi:hypothetical protein
MWIARTASVFICFLLSSIKYAEGSSGDSVFVGLGVFSHNVKRTSDSATGTTGILTTYYPELTLSLRFKLLGLRWAPFFGYTVAPYQNHDSVKTQVMALGLPNTFEFKLGNHKIDLKLGPGVFWNTVTGTGGTTSLPNGGGTMTFNLANQSVTSRIFFLDAGLGYQYKRLRFDIDGLMLAPLGSRRSLTVLANISYGIF